MASSSSTCRRARPVLFLLCNPARIYVLGQIASNWPVWTPAREVPLRPVRFHAWRARAMAAKTPPRRNRCGPPYLRCPRSICAASSDIPDACRNVDRVDHAQQVLDLQRHEQGGRTGEIHVQRARQFRREWLGWRGGRRGLQTLFPQRIEQRGAIELSFTQHVVADLLAPGYKLSAAAIRCLGPPSSCAGSACRASSPCPARGG